MQINEFKCDGCKKRVRATYNGEHLLPPRGWVSLFDVNQARTTGEHLCPNCLPRTPQNKIKRKR